tara:strand:+ start:129 stop:410 length:282 start_codon:yes stop_codon:yes gene_type:complete
MIRFINITKEAKMEELHKKDIEIYKKEIERLYKKIDYLEELDRKNFLQIIKLQGIINNYENNHIPYYKYEELQNDYINALQVINNKNKEANNE